MSQSQPTEPLAEAKRTGRGGATLAPALPATLAAGPRGYLLLVLALFVALGCCYNLIIPFADAPDEQEHYFFIEHLALTHTLPVLHPDELKRDAPIEAHQPPLYYTLAALLAGHWIKPLHDDPLRLPGNPAFDFVKPLPAYLRDPSQNFPWHGVALAWRLIRAFSLLLGCGSLVFIFLSAQMLLPRRPWLACACVAYAALNPQFIFHHAVITNDALAIFAGTFLIYAGLRAARDSRTGDFVLLGCAIGIALLSKLTTLVLMPGIGLAVLFALARRRALRDRLLLLTLVTAIPALLCGWWFFRNWRLYHHPLAANIQIQAWAACYYPQPLGLEKLLQTLPAMAWHTFRASWGIFGYDLIEMPRWVYAAILWAHLPAALGLLAAPLRGFRQRNASAPNISAWLREHRLLCVLLMTGISAGAGFLNYNRHANATGWVGRFLFPAMPVLALGFVLGWSSWLKKRDRALALGLLIAGIALQIVALGFVLIPVYR